MGGSGGGFTRRDNQILRNLAQKRMRGTLDGMSRKNCFISFSYEDDSKAVNALRAQAKNDNLDINFNDYSLKEPFDSKRAEYIKRKIREKLGHCSTTIVYCTKASAKSKWVNWEVEISLHLGKKVVCMYKGEKPPSKYPPAAKQAIKEGKVKAVQWSTEALMEAIND